LHSRTGMLRQESRSIHSELAVSSDLAVLSDTATITIGVGIVAYSPVDPNVRNLQGGMQ